MLAACVDRPLAGVDPPVLDAAAPRRLPAAGHAGARRTPPSPRPSTWSARSSARAPPASSTRCCAGSPRGPGNLAGPARARPRRTRSATWRSRTPTRDGSSARSRDALGGDRRAGRPRCSPTTSRPRCTWSPGRAARREELVDESGGADRRRSRLTASSCPGGDPGELAAVPTAGLTSRTRAASSSPLALAAAPLEGPDGRWLDLCAGPGGKAALLGALAAQRGAG